LFAVFAVGGGAHDTLHVFRLPAPTPTAKYVTALRSRGLVSGSPRRTGAAAAAAAGAVGSAHAAMELREDEADDEADDEDEEEEEDEEIGEK
jgi:hypothetical protein